MTTTLKLFGDLPAHAASHWRDGVAVTFDDRSVSFGEIHQQVDRAAKALIALGIQPGDKVGIWLTNKPEFIVALYAVFRVGAVAVPFNTRYREQDMAFVLEKAQCTVLITGDRSGPIDYLQMLRAILPELSVGRFTGSNRFAMLREVIVVRSSTSSPSAAGWSWTDFVANGDTLSGEQLMQVAVAVRPSDLALIVYTSGTTGNPKGVMHDHSCLPNICERADLWPLRAGDSVLNYLPMFHMYGLSETVVACMYTGVRQVVMETFQPERALDLIAQQRIAGIHGFDTHYADLLREQERSPRDLSSLRFGTFPSGMESSIAVARRVQRALCPTVTGMGMSEAWAWVCMSTLDDTEEQRCTTSGRPMAGVEICAIDPATGQRVPNGTPGELLYRGYTVMKGYFGDPEGTARVFDDDGWLHTGDQGLLRDDGFVQFTGRYKEMLRVGGENVSAVGVETELLHLVPEIDQVAVVPYPDARLSEVPVAYVVLKRGKTCSLETVQQACKGKIASFKIPRYVVLVESLPSTASGKVQRGVLRERAILDLAARGL